MAWALWQRCQTRRLRARGGIKVQTAIVYLNGDTMPTVQALKAAGIQTVLCGLPPHKKDTHGPEAHATKQLLAALGPVVAEEHITAALEIDHFAADPFLRWMTTNAAARIRDRLRCTAGTRLCGDPSRQRRAHKMLAGRSVREARCETRLRRRTRAVGLLRPRG